MKGVRKCKGFNIFIFVGSQLIILKVNGALSRSLSVYDPRK